MYNKAQTSTDTPIIIAIIAFQTFIILALGFLNINPEEQQVGTNFSIAGFDIVNFSQNIITNISELGVFSALLFTPLLVAVFYIVAKLIRGGG